MAAPILITAGVLTGLWVALGAKRAEMCTTCAGSSNAPDPEAPAQEAGFSPERPAIEQRDPGGPVVGDGPLVGSEGAAQGATMPGEAVVGDMGTSGTVAPIVTTQETATAPNAFVINAAASHGGSDPSTLASQPTTKPLAGKLSHVHADTAKILYGSTAGLTRQQRALAMSEVGTLTGEIW